MFGWIALGFLLGFASVVGFGIWLIHHKTNMTVEQWCNEVDDIQLAGKKKPYKKTIECADGTIIESVVE